MNTRSSLTYSNRNKILTQKKDNRQTKELTQSCDRNEHFDYSIDMIL